MYVQTAFRGAPADAKALLHERGFGTIIGHDGTSPHASHVPFLYHEDEGRLGRIAFHVAKPNPLHGVFAMHPAALLICQGADAYISPDWYKSDDQVPTWNYIMAGAMMALIPPVAVIVFMQRWFVKGLIESEK